MKREGYNRLGSEKSPYLLQHKDNPVWWYPWGDEAFRAAFEDRKPIFLSIGYSTCYWCHVMEKDSFEDQEVASFLNDHYICIKVDREERPDIDGVYMDAVVGLTGSGGWPMSVFLTPEAKPFWGGTFFPRDQFLGILQRINQVWREDKESIGRTADQITDALKVPRYSTAISANDEGVVDSFDEEPTHDNTKIFVKAATEYKQTFDRRWGGFGGAPKFPPSASLNFLMHGYSRTGDELMLEMVKVTLDRMARGGIYDHLGGGFARYSTDERWLVPHFEKMLYDNALLVSTYVSAYQITKDEEFSSVARETLDYVLRDLSDPAGGFHSAEDAGDVGEEGAYYVWSNEEIRTGITKEESDYFSKVYCITQEGNFENGKNVLQLKDTYTWAVKKDPLLRRATKGVLELRAERQRPRKDDKVLTGWNGLMIGALAEFGAVSNEPRYLKAAATAASFIESKLIKHGKLLRRYRDGEAGVDGTLEDYVYLIDGLLKLYQSEFDLKWLLLAKDIQGYQDSLFWDPEGLGYFVSVASELPVKRKEFMDGATPSPNGLALLNLIRLYGFFGDMELFQKVSALANIFYATASERPANYPTALRGLLQSVGEFRQIVLVSERTDPLLQEILTFLRSTYLPSTIISHMTPAQAQDRELPALLLKKEMLNGRATIYVCENRTCKLPVHTLSEMKRQLGFPDEETYQKRPQKKGNREPG